MLVFTAKSRIFRRLMRPRYGNVNIGEHAWALKNSA